MLMAWVRKSKTSQPGRGGNGMVLTQSDSSRNARRFYRMEIVPGLFGDWVLVPEWGRIGRGGQVRTDWFSSESDAKGARFKLHMAKAKRG